MCQFNQCFMFHTDGRMAVVLFSLTAAAAAVASAIEMNKIFDFVFYDRSNFSFFFQSIPSNGILRSTTATYAQTKKKKKECARKK